MFSRFRKGGRNRIRLLQMTRIAVHLIELLKGDTRFLDQFTKTKSDNNHRDKFSQ